ncbi:hypothetical protein SRHO_G00075990 [Serrasalmus rhombeus]
MHQSQVLVAQGRGIQSELETSRIPNPAVQGASSEGHGLLQCPEPPHSQCWSDGPPLSVQSLCPMELDTAELMPKTETKLYTRRWIMLLLFSFCSTSNALMWLQYGIISNIFMRFYSVDALAIDWLSMIFMLTYVPLIVPGMWLMDVRGLREALLIGAAFNCVGSWVKLGGVEPDLFPVAFFGQFVCSVAMVFILGVPPRLASLWFGEREVSTACSIGVLGNQLGIAIGFLVPPILVPNVEDLDELAGSHQSHVLHHSRRGHVPLHPGDHCTLLNQMIIKHYPGEEVNAGRIGLTIVIAGMVGSLICGIWLDRTKSYKQTTLAVYVMSLVGMLVYAFTLSLGHLWVVFITAGALGFFMTGYLPLGFEFAVELTYPESEGTSSGLLNCSAQVFGIIFTICQGKIIERFGTLAGNLFLCAFLLIGTILTGFIRSDLRRQMANQLAKTAAASGHHEGQDYGATAPINASHF